MALLRIEQEASTPVPCLAAPASMPSCRRVARRRAEHHIVLERLNAMRDQLLRISEGIAGARWISADESPRHPDNVRQLIPLLTMSQGAAPDSNHCHDLTPMKYNFRVRSGVRSEG